jgi:ABC-type proline/glycine betaine transport system substrate-binding protein
MAPHLLLVQVLISLVAADNFYEFPGQVMKPIYQIPFDQFGDLNNHAQNCTLDISKYFMMIGCADGWTGMQTTNTFLDARNNRQMVKFQDQMQNKQKPLI